MVNAEDPLTGYALPSMAAVLQETQTGVDIAPVVPADMTYQ